MKTTQHRIKHRTWDEILLATIKYVVVLTFTFMCAYPFYYVIIYSISDPSLLLTKKPMLYPIGFTLETYKGIFERDDIWKAFGISIARTVSGTFLTTVCSAMLAFMMTQEMTAKKFVKKFITITMYVGGGLIPNYILLKFLGLHNNFLVYIVPCALSVFQMILIRTFIEQLPQSLLESAELDGAGLFRLFFRIVVPLSKPILATVALNCAVGQWNSWMDNFLYVRDSDLKTLQYILQTYLSQANAIMKAITQGTLMADEVAARITPVTVQMTAVVITTLPIMLVYPFLQKYFAKGVMIGAIKG